MMGRMTDQQRMAATFKRAGSVFGAALLSAALLAAPVRAETDRGAAAAAVHRLMASSMFQKAVEQIRGDHARIVEEAIALQQIPAPNRREERKGRAFLEMLRANGLSDVMMDGEGNVTGLRRGAGGSGMVAVVAHLDTVFPEGTDLTVRREGTRLRGPGLADNSHGLAVILALVRAMDAAGVSHRDDILFVGSVGEEGLGDLRGVKYLLTRGPYRGRITTFIALDGTDPGEIVNAALGSKRYRVTFTGPGGHSYLAFGTVNPLHALAGVVQRLGTFEVPAGTTFNVGVVAGGTVVNAIPTEAVMQVDLRSVSPTDLDALERRFLAAVDEAVAAENAARSTANGAIAATVERVGDRPSGITSPDGDLVAIATAAVAANGFEPRLSTSSTDANVAIGLGIPAITIASGIGGREHTLEEFLDIEPSAHLRQIAMNLAVILTVAGAGDGAQLPANDRAR